MSTCTCPEPGDSRPVLVDMEACEIRVKCAGCKLPLGYTDSIVQMLVATDLPMTLTVVESYDDGPEPPVLTGGWYELTVRAET